MTKPENPELTDALISEVMSKMGTRGGKKKTNKPKGIAAMSPERRREIALAGVEARKKKKESAGQP